MCFSHRNGGNLPLQLQDASTESRPKNRRCIGFLVVMSCNTSWNPIKPAGMVKSCTNPKTNRTMENPPFEDVFPIENGDFQCHVSAHGCNS